MHLQYCLSCVVMLTDAQSPEWACPCLSHMYPHVLIMPLVPGWADDTVRGAGTVLPSSHRKSE